jgi:hypothetical protein
MIHRHFFAGLIAALALGKLSLADDVRYTTDANGVQYQETHRMVKRPVSETQIVENQQTVYTNRVTTEYQPNYRTVYSPITEYAWEPYLANRWNPLASPSVQYRYVPHTRWETRTEEVHVPVTRSELVPEQRITRTPVVTQRFVDEEQISRVAVSNSGQFSNTTVASRPIGGTSLSGDPPRSASSPAATFVDRR